MASPIILAFYDLKDGISSKLKSINDSLRGNQKESDRTADASERSGKRISDSYKKVGDGLGQLRTALAAVGALVGLDKVKDGIEAVLTAGEDLDDLQKRFATAFGGIAEGAKAFDQVRELAKGLPQSFTDVSDAAIALTVARARTQGGRLDRHQQSDIPERQPEGSRSVHPTDQERARRARDAELRAIQAQSHVLRLRVTYDEAPAPALIPSAVNA